MHLYRWRRLPFSTLYCFGPKLVSIQDFHSLHTIRFGLVRCAQSSWTKIYVVRLSHSSSFSNDLWGSVESPSATLSLTLPVLRCGTSSWWRVTTRMMAVEGLRACKIIDEHDIRSVTSAPNDHSLFVVGASPCRPLIPLMSHVLAKLANNLSNCCLCLCCK
jgi:hypothetical protein